MPKMQSLKTKLTVTKGLIGLTGIIVVFLLTWFVSQQRTINNAITEADNLSDQIAYSISIISAQDEDKTFNYQRLVEKTATLHDIYSIKVLDENGMILADDDISRVGQILKSPLITNALENQRKEQQLNGNTLIVVRPLHGEAYTNHLNDITGLLWIELNLTNAYMRAKEDILLGLTVSLGGFLMVFYWYFQITQSGILDRLGVLSEGLLNVENGDMTQRISVRKLFGTEDEINTLANQFNQMMTSLHRKLTFEELTTHLVANFMNIPSDEVDIAIQNTLQRLGVLFEIDRTYIFEFTNNGKLMNNTYEWCATDISPQMENLQNIPSAIVPWWMELLNKGETIIVPRVSEMPPEASSERGILEEQSIKSVLVMPLTSDLGLFGFLGLDSVLCERNWSVEEVNLLRVLMGIITNTIIRQRSQLELIEERDFALQVMNTIGQGLTVTNEQGIFEYANPAYADMVKYPLDQLIGKSPIEFTHPNDRQSQFEEFKKRKAGQISTYISRLLASDGTATSVLINATPRIRGGVASGSIAAITNLTEQLREEEKLLQSEARNRAFLNAIPDLIFRMDENGTFLDYKAGDNKHFFLPQEKIIGTSVDSILPPEIGAMTMSAIKTSLHTSTPQIFEYKLQTQGGLFTYEARIVASSPHEVITIIHDITERTRLEQMKTDFINRASHELRTPITTAILMVDLLDRTDLDPNERGDYWKILKQELNRERIILEDVLTVGRIESGRYRIAGGSVSILPVLNNAINAMQAQADLRKIAIHVEISEQIPNLRGAEEAFARVFNNIISNAVKFSNPEGTVKVHACQKGNEVIIDVADHGIGIPPEDLPHITSRFFRGTNASNLEIPGSGIGLYIIKNIVEELGGKLNIHSILGQGTTISVCFPISRE